MLLSYAQLLHRFNLGLTILAGSQAGSLICYL